MKPLKQDSATISFLAVLSGATAACTDLSGDTTGQHSVYTDLTGDACVERIDQSDPNENRYLLCPGVLGYSLVVRRAGSGRQSVDVRTPIGEEFPLDFEVFVTRGMSELEGPAEWRVTTSNGSESPVAVIIGVGVHGDDERPEDVTQTYTVLTKLAPDEICVVESIVNGTDDSIAMAGSANEIAASECLEPLPDD